MGATLAVGVGPTRSTLRLPAQPLRREAEDDEEQVADDPQE
ncbi:hypothetical protein [uncultured Corynebacterium sp.]|nr:hypothetical protein [uncultured Corynebacterium sp.]